LRHCRRIISRRLETESTLVRAFGESWLKNSAVSRAVLTTPPAGAIAWVG
jgi:hypothetical protein